MPSRVVTDGAGRFRFERLPFDGYRLSASAKKFRAESVDCELTSAASQRECSLSLEHGGWLRLVPAAKGRLDVSLLRVDSMLLPDIPEQRASLSAILARAADGAFWLECDWAPERLIPEHRLPEHRLDGGFIRLSLRISVPARDRAASDESELIVDLAPSAVTEVVIGN